MNLLSMDNELKPLLIALTKLVVDLANETAELMENRSSSLAAPHVGGLRDKAHKIRESGQQVLGLFESVLGEGSK
jgi:hypothetical protein